MVGVSESAMLWQPDPTNSGSHDREEGSHESHLTVSETVVTELRESQSEESMQNTATRPTHRLMRETQSDWYNI